MANPDRNGREVEPESRLHLEIGARLSELAPASAQVRHFLDEHRVDHAAVFAIETAIEELVTNAIKYTPMGRSVWVTIDDEGDWVHIKVRDEGVGIEEDELPLLFTKYSKISSRPTNGEASTGLGLSIVKRMVDELNGKIFCESEKGRGSVFTVILKK